MKSLNLIDKSLLGCFLVLLVLVFTVPDLKAQGGVGGDTCPEYCEELCGTPTINPCQYTFCPGSTGSEGVMCTGVLQ